MLKRFNGKLLFELIRWWCGWSGGGAELEGSGSDRGRAEDGFGEQLGRAGAPGVREAVEGAGGQAVGADELPERAGVEAAVRVDLQAPQPPHEGERAGRIARIVRAEPGHQLPR